MDFLDPAKKRQHTIKLFIGYMLVAIALALTSWLIFLITLGYSYNRHTGQVTQNGLVFVQSKPVTADVFVNGQNKGKTNLRLNIASGKYTFLLKSSGYRDWSRTFYVDGGSVEQLFYPRLFPSKLVRTDQKLYSSAPRLSTQSLDRRWLLIQDASSINKFDEFDLKSSSPSLTSLSLPTSLFTAASGTHKLTVMEWSTDDRHVLIQHSFHGGSEFIMIDRASPSSSVNLSKLLGVNPTSVVMRNQHFDKLYIYSKKTQTISTADVKTGSVAALLDKVITFTANGPNQVIYVTNDGLVRGKVAVKVWDGQKSYLLNHYLGKSEYKLMADSYGGADYLVVAPISTGDAYIYKNPLLSAQSGRTPFPFKVLSVKNLKFLSFSPKSRFIAAQSGSNFGVYDIDSDSRYYYQLRQPLATTIGATWMDEQHLTLPVKDKTLVLDYDGINQQLLSATLPGLSGFFDPGYKQLYNIAPSEQSAGKIGLTRTTLTVQNASNQGIF